jgi:hypothetical protein
VKNKNPKGEMIMKIPTTFIKTVIAETSKALISLLPFIYEQLRRRKRR